MCSVKLRFSSIWTPSSFISSVFAISRSFMLSVLSPLSLSSFRGLMFRDWNLSGLASRKLLFEYHDSACWRCVFILHPTVSWSLPLTYIWWSSANSLSGMPVWELYSSQTDWQFRPTLHPSEHQYHPNINGLGIYQFFLWFSINVLHKQRAVQRLWELPVSAATRASLRLTCPTPANSLPPSHDQA